VIENIKNNKNVSVASPMIVSQLPNPERHRLDLIYGMEMSHIKALKPAWEIKGSIPSGNDEVIIGYEVAKHDNINIGDMLDYRSVGRSFTVSGIIKRTGGQDDAFILYAHSGCSGNPEQAWRGNCHRRKSFRCNSHIKNCG
jgi:putative ABC transport system permease protein